MEKVVYIAGPMRHHKCFNFPQFFYWQVKFEKSGYKVINPAELDCERWIEDGWIFTDDKYEEVLGEDCRLIREEADILFVLTGWEESEGANKEIEEAKKKGITIAYEDCPVGNSK